MRKSVSIAMGMVAGLMLSTGLQWMDRGVAVLASASPGDTAADDAPAQGGSAQGPRFALGSDETPPPGGWLTTNVALPAPTPGETLVYFQPTDNDATATVLTLINTDTADHTVALRGFSHDGVLAFSQNIVVPASSFRRMASDSLTAAPPPSWTTPATLITNFTDFVYFASLSLPQGVKADGYTLFNPGTGTVDPRLDQGAVPLTFHSASPLAPGAPVNLAASASGGVVTITWAAPTTGGLATSYVLEAGSAPGQANLATVPVGTTSFSASGVPRGTYFLRVRAVNSVGTGPASAEVQLVVP